MSFLEDYWDDIEPRSKVPLYSCSTWECAGKSFLAPWMSENTNMAMIGKAISMLRPKVVMELGTFEAHGTKRIALSMMTYQGKDRILYTFDVGKAPVNSLGVPYGCKDFSEQPLVDWQSFKNGHPCFTGWHSWGDIMEARDRRLTETRALIDFPLHFVEGFTYDTLPKVLEEDIKKWDFCFQDTLHTTKEVIKEWLLFQPYSGVGSIVVFDDMAHPSNPCNADFLDWFRDNERDWITRHTIHGHGQLWAEKVR
jgi:hypothetical protein